jgi:4-amino-4-deoxy-L-arabinose transferase-like glycosyltransferase
MAALALFHGMGTATLPLFDRDEPRFAEAAREMLERGDFVVPYFNNVPRLQKPPLTYWCQVFFYKLFGESEWSARLPSVLAASVSTLVIFGFGSSLYGRRVGLWAAVVFSLSVHTMILAKTATADMLMVLFVTLASWAGWELFGTSKTTRSPWWGMLYYGSLALGFLAKGPVAWLPLVMSVPNRKRGLLGGILLVLVLVGIW